ncbi:carboxyl transferase domain-containing protein [Actinomycetospora corticicola]|uniref:Acetyl/propionyl-CoA carboxylase alpha subunit/acetyl-CoA carboxylase carboxyltransferase component n=1 Tax=Actinomycetospora corticicola TaxID=663602 RepID=A0A7Y9J479_9PSEU|nr:acetyl/propionyl-CoA carboxylase alpha subunit/acetyl-CoA carboxylase carboxyltransferase component [Actinomycetospora corticicola]
MRRVLIANRGEIAVRIADAVAALGLEAVFVHAADEPAPDGVAFLPLDASNDAFLPRGLRLPGTGPAAYLDVDVVIAAAKEAGADAVHPGYGFLSENPALARACEDAGIVFVGPSPATLEEFGDKARARERAAELGVPVLDDDGTTPVVVKAVSGGGGRGMRVVRDRTELDEARRAAAAEAKAAFGDDRVFVERYLEGARHVEVQLLGDSREVVVLADRDCSLQRRHQKMVEIAPAPDLPDDVRARLHEHAHALGTSTELRGLATVEFLVAGAEVAFLEVNPRLQVEHTVTEEVLGVDLVVAALRVADGARLADLALPTVPRGVAVQARVCAETLGADASVRSTAGTLTRFTPPSGRGVRVDTHGRAGLVVDPRYDSLLAKVVVHDADLPRALAHLDRALATFDLDGVPTTIPVLRALLARPEVLAPDTGLVERLLPEIVRGGSERSIGTRVPLTPDGQEGAALRAEMAGTVVAVEAEPGHTVAAGAPVVVLEAMKMEHVLGAPAGGTVTAVRVAVGDVVAEGDVLALLEPGDHDTAAAENADVDPDHVRPDLAEVLDRRRLTADEARPAAVTRRRDAGRRTARENVADLCDEGTFVEYGAFAVAAQRKRRTLQDLRERTPADGIVTGIGAVDGRRVVVLAYDYTVLAGTQGVLSHAKTDRALQLALDHDLPVVLFAEGGGGRPGETDTIAVAQLDVPTFALFAQLSGRVPTVAVVAGYCFAGNAALAGCADLVVAVEGANLGMGGPAMIAGGGLGEVDPHDVGPTAVQVPNGVVDVLVDDEAAAVGVARRYLALDRVVPGERPDQRRLRHVVPENRLRVYDVRAAVDALVDSGSVLELRPRYGVGVVTAFARLAGRPIGLMANDPRRLGGAIDAEAAEKAARFLQLCDARGLPVVSLCDTPGFMVGPDAEATATVRRFSRMFVTGANLRVPVVCVVLRKAYGLGAMAMAGGSMRVPVATVAWPSGEFGGMGLEGAVRLGYAKELAALPDDGSRQARYDELVAALYEQGKALSAAEVVEIDDVIDPADTAAVVLAALDAADGPLPPRRTIVDTR